MDKVCKIENKNSVSFHVSPCDRPSIFFFLQHWMLMLVCLSGLLAVLANRKFTVVSSSRLTALWSKEECGIGCPRSWQLGMSFDNVGVCLVSTIFCVSWVVLLLAHNWVWGHLLSLEMLVWHWNTASLSHWAGGNIVKWRLLDNLLSACAKISNFASWFLLIKL